MCVFMYLLENVCMYKNIYVYSRIYWYIVLYFLAYLLLRNVDYKIAGGSWGQIDYMCNLQCLFSENIGALELILKHLIIPKYTRYIQICTRYIQNTMRPRLGLAPRRPRMPGARASGPGRAAIVHRLNKELLTNTSEPFFTWQTLFGTV